MSSTNNSSNRMVVPEAKEAMDKVYKEVIDKITAADSNFFATVKQL